MQCPKCKAKMLPVSVGDVEVDRCANCAGLWFDTREHEVLKNVKGSERIDDGGAALSAIHDAMRDYPCPRCGGAMVPMTVHHQPHIHYEQCITCGGAYFDAGEFADYKELTLAEALNRFFALLRE